MLSKNNIAETSNWVNFRGEKLGHNIHIILNNAIVIDGNIRANFYEEKQRREKIASE